MIKPVNSWSNAEKQSFVGLLLDVAGLDGIKHNHLASAIAQHERKITVAFGVARLCEMLPLPVLEDEDEPYDEIQRRVA